MPGSFASLLRVMNRTLEGLAVRAATPGPRVAQHWVTPGRLTWFGACADHSELHVSWSFGRLKDVALVPGTRHTVGVFRVSPTAFPGLELEALAPALESMVPVAVDGPTRVFLLRVAAQLSLGEALLSLRARSECEVSLFARPDAVETHAPTPRWPEHARARVAGALTLLDADFSSRCERVWGAEATELLRALEQ